MNSRLLAPLLAILCQGHLFAEDVLWPSVEFEHVTAYCYDCFKDERGVSILFHEKELHHGIIPCLTTRLTKEQVAEFRTLVSTKSTGELEEIECYDPHHAFVFYDKNWNSVASFEACFLCGNWRSMPGGLLPIDLDALKTFTAKLGMPLFETNEEYRQLYEQTSSSPPAAYSLENSGLSKDLKYGLDSEHPVVLPMRQQDNEKEVVQSYLAKLADAAGDPIRFTLLEVNGGLFTYQTELMQQRVTVYLEVDSDPFAPEDFGVPLGFSSPQNPDWKPPVLGSIWLRRWLPAEEKESP